MLTRADTDRAHAVPCPLTFCRAAIGEHCVSRTFPGLTVPPHQHRLIAAGVTTPPPTRQQETA